MSKRSPRLQFSDEERASPKLKKAIQKADKKADKLDKAEAKIPKKTVKRKKRVVDSEGRVTTRLYFSTGCLMSAFTHSMNLLGCKGIFGRDYESDISDEMKEKVTAALRAMGEI